MATKTQLLNTSRLEKISTRISNLPAPLRLTVFLGALSVLWLPLALPIYWLLRNNSNLASILTMALLFVELLFFWRVWGKFVHQENQIYRRYGLTRNSKNAGEFGRGLAIGFWLCLGLFIIEALLGWIRVINSSSNLFKTILEGLFSATGIALAEELLFRGWLLDELQQNYNKNICIYVTGDRLFRSSFFKTD